MRTLLTRCTAATLPVLAGALLAVSLMLNLTAPALAHDYKVGAIAIDHPYAHPNPPGTVNAGAYINALRNTGAVADRLIAASTPVAARIELHEMRMDGNIMRMRELPRGIEVPAKGEVSMRQGAPAGYHLMVMSLKQPLREGDKIPVTLRFEKAGTVEVVVNVEARKASASSPTHGGHHH